MADIDGDGIPEIAFQSAFAMQAANSAGLNWLARSRRRPAAAVEGREDRRVPDLASRRVGRSRRRRQAGAVERAAARPEEPGADLRPGQGVGLLVQPEGLDAAHRHRRHSRHHPPRAAGEVGRQQARAVSGRQLRRHRALPRDRQPARDEVREAAALGRATPRRRRAWAPATSASASRTASASSPRSSRGTATRSSSTPTRAAQWERRVIYDKVASGHEIAVVDLNGDGRDDIVANDNSRPSQNNPDRAERRRARVLRA